MCIGKTSIRLAGLAVALIGATLPAYAAEQQNPPPAPAAFKSMRHEEDWSKFSTDKGLDSIKHITLSDDVWVSVGGSIRLRYESWDNFGFAEGADDDLSFFRTHLHTDWHFGEHWRVFLEGRFADTTNRDLPGGRREGSDFDRGDLSTAFVEANYPVGQYKLSVKGGRFPMEYGKQRLIAVADWSNNRRIYEGVQLRLQDPEKKWMLDAFAVRPVAVDGAGLTLNESTKHTWFSGLYFQSKPSWKYLDTLEAYLLAFNADDEAPLPQDRYTLGVRLAGPGPITNLTWEVEAAYQIGRTDGAPGKLPMSSEEVRAWMLSAETTYTFADYAMSPWVTLGLDLASGDSDRSDDENQSFNPLFALGHAHFGYLDFIGRRNIADARVSVGAWPIEKKLKVWSDLHFFYRLDDDDALYNASIAVQRAPLYLTPAGDTKLAGEKDAGIELDITASYQFSRRGTAIVGYGHFWDAEFLAVTGPHEDVDFFYTSVEFKF